ncbi:DUF4760 domain-containing protein [Pseudomonas putida]|uniref:DUF4760 domain-containing protein n=1 Tax=Pseudomonas putida TaxID=303 RepID=UPI003D979A98
MDAQFWATIVAPIVQAATSIAGVVGLLLVWYQVRITNAWNRATTQHALLSNLPSFELEERVWKILEPLPKDDHWRLKSDACSILYKNITDWVAVKTYLNKHEQLCAAVCANAVNERYAYDVHGAKIVDTFLTFEKYIEYARSQAEDITIYLELEKVATKWSELAQTEKASVNAQQAALKASRGTKDAVG